MLNGVNINYVVVLFVTGAVLIAAIYHTILYLHRKENLLLFYSSYLWSTFSYCIFRVIVFKDIPWVYRYMNPDEILQMISFIMYIRFVAYAMDLDIKKDKKARLFVKMTPYIIGIYLLINTLLIIVKIDETPIYFISKSIARAFLLFPGLSFLIIIVRKRESGYYRYLGAGATSLILFGLVSTLLNLILPQKFILGSISWLMFGFFTDVIFFSAAIGYRIREEHNIKEKSLKDIIKKDGELKAKEMEKIKAIYEAREQERNRIARDLHDDVGATLSSIHVYSSVAAKTMESDKEKLFSILQRIKDNSKEVMENMSDIIWAIQVNPAGNLSLENKLRNYGYELLSPLNIRCDYLVQSAAEKKLTNIELRKNILLIAKEAMNNIAKYSFASEASVSLSLINDELLLKISDNGNGFDEKNIHKGNGLQNMKKRSEVLEGKLIISSELNSGTSIIIQVPLTKISSENNS